MQLEFFDVPSPCVGICQLDDKGRCLGCFRTRDERLNWLSFNSDERQKVIKRCVQRSRRKSAPVKVKHVAVHVEENQPSLFDAPTEIHINHNDDLDFGDFEL